jgi:CheY-like chemotaxis protein
VVWNLLANAIKFTPTGGNVVLRLQVEAAAVELTVGDDGQGIPLEVLPDIFERFRQAETTFSRSHGGLGLGLAIVRHIVTLHGGTVRAHSEGTGKGSTFAVWLPSMAARATPHPSSPRRPSSIASLIAHDRLGGLRVLLVDDDDDGREVTAAILRAHGAVVDTAASAREAVGMLDLAVPDILVSDIGMPEEDGLSLLRRVRARPAADGGRVPAVALTAYARAEDRTKSLMAGFNTHVTKPVETAELVMALANLTGRFQR